MEPSCDAAVAPSTSYNELPALHAITLSARSAREHRCQDGERIGQQRLRTCQTAPGLGAFYRGGRRPKRGITCSTRGQGAGQDDRLRRSSRTHRRALAVWRPIRFTPELLFEYNAVGIAAGFRFRATLVDPAIPPITRGLLRAVPRGRAQRKSQMELLLEPSRSRLSFRFTQLTAAISLSIAERPPKHSQE